MKLLALFLFIINLSFAEERIRPNFYENPQMVKVVRSIIPSLQKKFFKILGHKSSLDKSVYTNYNKSSKLYYVFRDNCLNNDSDLKKCNEVRVEILNSFLDLYDSIGKKKESLTLLESLLKLQTQSIKIQKNKIKSKIFKEEFFMKEMRTVFKDFFWQLNRYNSKSFSSTLFHFWNDFIFPSYSFLTKDSNLSLLYFSFSRFNSAAYNFAHTMRIDPKLDSRIKSEVGSFINQWNLLRKNLYYDYQAYKK